MTWAIEVSQRVRSFGIGNRIFKPGLHLLSDEEGEQLYAQMENSPTAGVRVFEQADLEEAQYENDPASPGPMTTADLRPESPARRGCGYPECNAFGQVFTNIGARTRHINLVHGGKEHEAVTNEEKPEQTRPEMKISSITEEPDTPAPNEMTERSGPADQTQTAPSERISNIQEGQTNVPPQQGEGQPSQMPPADEQSK